MKKLVVAGFARCVGTANVIYGTPTKPGVYKVTVSLTNTSVKKALVREFTIEVPNFTAANSYFVDALDNGVGEKRVLTVGVSNIADYLPNLELNKDVKLAVSGLPSGLKYDAKTGKINGIATKAGTYTVYLTVTDGREKYVSTFTVEVEALPDWVVGTFNGYVDGRDEDGGDWVDWLFLTISSAGKVSYKDLTEDTSIHTVKPSDIDFLRNDEGGYSVVIEQLGKDWYRKDVLMISLHEIDGVEVGRVDGLVSGYDFEFDDNGNEIRYGYNAETFALQNVWKAVKGTKLAPEFIKNTATTISMEEMRDD